MKKKINFNPLISIIINCHNASNYISKSINSVIKQTYQNWELIIYDNNSNDKTFTIIKKFLKNKKIKYYKSKSFLNLYNARNLAVKKTKGEFVAFLDSDDWWIKEKLKKQVNFLSKNKNINIIFSNLYLFDETKNKTKIFSYNKLYNGHITQDLLNDFKMPILTTLIRKKILKKYKFDKKYNIIGDFDLFTKISLKEKILSTQEPLAYYRIHSEQLQKKEMINQANQYCKWYKEKKISKTFKNYDLSTIHRKYDYFNLLKELNSNKIKLFLKMFKNFNFVNFIKITAIIFLPKKILYNLIQNV